MFLDRYDAGKRLASRLVQYSGSDAVIFAIPRGGVITGFEVARLLGLPLDIVITRKIGHPLNSEFAVCAIGEDGERICSSNSHLFGIDTSWIRFESQAQQNEAQRRREKYGTAITPNSVTGKTVIIVDDGIATGLSILAAIHSVQKMKPKKIVVAAPVAPNDVVKKLHSLVDEIVILEDTPHYLGSVGAYYTHFPEVFDKEVIVLLREANKLYKKAHTRSQKAINTQQESAMHAKN